MYASRECAGLDNRDCGDCQDPECECPKHDPCQSQALGYKGDVDLSCDLHAGHPGPHQLHLEWEGDDGIC